MNLRNEPWIILLASVASVACETTVTRPPVSEYASEPPTRPSVPAEYPKATAHAAVGAPQSVLIYDGERPERDSRIVDTVAKEEGERILDRVFPVRLRDRDQCPPDAHERSLKEQQERHEVVPRVDEAIDGSFTLARAPQRLYVIFVGECFATHADNWSSKLLLVTEGENTRAVISEGIDGSTTIAGIFDLDGDGRHEVLLTSGFTNQGHSLVHASLERIDPSRLITVESFDKVSEDGCASPLPGGTWKSSKIVASRSSTGRVTFSTSTSTGSCDRLRAVD